MSFTGDVDLLSKKRVYDKVMLVARLKEEEGILVQEMSQHWQKLAGEAASLRTTIREIGETGPNLN